MSFAIQATFALSFAPMSEPLSDESFWSRQNSSSPQHDHPDVSSAPVRPSHPHFEIFITSPAGKPLFYFAYDKSHPQHPNHDSSAATRPRASIASLAATLTGFQATTSNRISFIKSGSDTLVAYVHNSLHLALFAHHQPAPLPFLQALVRITIAAVQSLLSASLSDHLREKPNSMPSFASAEPLIRAVLLDALTHPLPYSLLKPAVLSTTSPSTSRTQLGQHLRNVLRNHSNLSHAFILTAGPPFPTRIIVSCGPANDQLSPLDMLLLTAMPDVVKDGCTFYPQSQSFRYGTKVFSRLVQLRLHPDHHDIFKAAVGGQSWRPEWTHMSPHTVRVVVLGHEDPTLFFNQTETVLDRTKTTTQLLVSMERPFSVKPFGVHGMRAILALHDEQRLAGTVTSFSYEFGIATLLSLRRVRMATNEKDRQDGEKVVISSFAPRNLHVVFWAQRFVILFDDEVSSDAAIQVTREVIAPQLERHMSSIIPKGERAFIPPNTPLAGLLAPFVS